MPGQRRPKTKKKKELEGCPNCGCMMKHTCESLPADWAKSAKWVKYGKT